MAKFAAMMAAWGTSAAAASAATAAASAGIGSAAAGAIGASGLGTIAAASVPFQISSFALPSISWGALAQGAGVIGMAAGQAQQGQYGQQSLDYQAAVYRQQAEREQELAKLEAMRAQKDDDALAGRQRAILAAQGRDISEGSALLVQQDFADETAYQEALTAAGGDTRAYRLRQDAELAAMAGRNARFAGNVRAGTTLLKGAKELWG